MTYQRTIATNTNLAIYKDVSPFTEPRLSTHSKKQKLELQTLHRVFPSSSLHTYTLLFLALCLSIYNLLLLHIDIPKILLYQYTDLTLKNVINIYLKNLTSKIKFSCLNLVRHEIHILIDRLNKYVLLYNLTKTKNM